MIKIIKRIKIQDLIIYFSLILISLVIKFLFPNKLNSYFLFIFLAFFSILLIKFHNNLKIGIFFFIILFLAGSHKEVQKKYFSFMSIMHWNDGVKIFSSLPYNFLKGNYKKNLEEVFVHDKGNNTGIIEIDEIYYLLRLYEINDYYLSNQLQIKIDENILFKQRLKETSYPSKMKTKINQGLYYKFFEISENLSKNCKIKKKIIKIKIAECL